MPRVVCVIAVTLVLATPTLHDPVAAQQRESRVVIATHVACRSAPDVSADVVVQYQLGNVFFPADESESDSGTWHLDTIRVPATSPGCWIHGSLTMEWSDRERALLAAADRILGRTDPVAFEDFVAVDNLLQQTAAGAHASSTVLETSPLLQLRRLQLLERAARAPGTWGTEVRRNPLRAAWFFANEDVLRYHEPAGSWIVPADAYWRLHDRYRSTPLAEELAWVAATGAVPGDECDALCVLGRLNRTYARYWATYPAGRWLNDALTSAQPQLEYARQVGCFNGAAEARAEANAFRDTLREVTSAEKQTLLNLASDIELRCGG